MRRLIINKDLSKSNHHIVRYLSCQTVRSTAYLNFCSGCICRLKGLGTYRLRLEASGPGLALRVNALALRLSPCLQHCPSYLVLDPLPNTAQYKDIKHATDIDIGITVCQIKHYPHIQHKPTILGNILDDYKMQHVKACMRTKLSTKLQHYKHILQTKNSKIHGAKC